MRRLHIFRAGKHAPMQGGSLDFSEAHLAATAAAYDPALYEAPIVVGHPRLDAPAYGWIAGLAATQGDLFATPKQVEPQFAEMVQAGRFKHISPSFWRPDAPGNPKPGVYSLKHVGFLGAVPPAVKGLKPVEFAGEDVGLLTLTIDFSDLSGWRMGWLVSDIAGLLRGVRDYIVGKEGAEAADRLVPGATLQRVTEEAARLQAEPPEADAPSMPDFADPPTTETTVTAEELARQQAALEAREREIQQREASFAERAAELRRADIGAFVDGLVKGAKLPQGLRDRTVAFMAALPAEGEVSFAEGGKTVKETPEAAFRGLLSALPAAVSFGEHAAGDGPGARAVQAATADFAGLPVDADRMELHSRAVEYQRRHPGTDYLAAVQAVEQAG